MIFVEYWLRRKSSANGQGHRTIAICLLGDLEQESFARGFSILSPKDRLDPKEGMKRARNRAYKAFYSGKNSEPCRTKVALGILVDALTNKHPKEVNKKKGLVGEEFNYKSHTAPVLSVFEKNCLARQL